MKSKITKEYYEKVKEESRVADMFLNSSEFKFIRDILNNSIESISSQILSGIASESNVYLTSLQTTDFQAQYRWIKKFLSDMEYFSNLIKQLDKDISNNTVVVEGGNVKDINYAK